MTFHCAWHTIAYYAVIVFKMTDLWPKRRVLPW